MVRERLTRRRSAGHLLAVVVPVVLRIAKRRFPTYRKLARLRFPTLADVAMRYSPILKTVASRPLTGRSRYLSLSRLAHLVARRPYWYTRCLLKTVLTGVDVPQTLFIASPALVTRECRWSPIRRLFNAMFRHVNGGSS